MVVRLFGGVPVDVDGVQPPAILACFGILHAVALNKRGLVSRQANIAKARDIAHGQDGHQMAPKREFDYIDTQS